MPIHPAARLAVAPKSARKRHNFPWYTLVMGVRARVQICELPGVLSDEKPETLYPNLHTPLAELPRSGETTFLGLFLFLYLHAIEAAAAVTSTYSVTAAEPTSDCCYCYPCSSC